MINKMLFAKILSAIPCAARKQTCDARQALVGAVDCDRHVPLLVQIEMGQYFIIVCCNIFYYIVVSYTIRCSILKYITVYSGIL